MFYVPYQRTGLCIVDVDEESPLGSGAIQLKRVLDQVLATTSAALLLADDGPSAKSTLMGRLQAGALQSVTSNTDGTISHSFVVRSVADK